jgi:hypothetical protein
MRRVGTALAIGLTLLSSRRVYGAEEEQVRLYRTAEEEREVGLKRKLTSWLTASGLAEGEWFRDDYTLAEGGREVTHDLEAKVQLGLVATGSESFKAEVLLELDTIQKTLELDEGLLSFETGPWEVEVGQQSLPFGVFFSRFVSPPILELGEVRAPSVIASYGHQELFDAKLGLYWGRKREDGGGTGTLDWTLAMDFYPAPTLALGWSYVSDIADSDAKLLEDVEEPDVGKVPGISAYVSRLGKQLDFSLEIVAASRSLDGLESDRDHPLAWNFELAHIFHRRYEVAFRLEGSREVEDAPERRIGVAGTVRLGKRASLTAEFLRGWFASGLSTSEDEQDRDRGNFLAARVSVAF